MTRREREGPLDLVTDEALSALVDGELAPREERALRARAASDPALAERLARFEALTEALRADPGADARAADTAALGERLTARIAVQADDAGTSLDDTPPVFAGEAGPAGPPGAVAEGGAGDVIELAARRRTLRTAAAVAAAVAAAIAVAVVLRSSNDPLDPALPPDARRPALAEHEAAPQPPEPTPASPDGRPDERSPQLAEREQPQSRPPPATEVAPPSPQKIAERTPPSGLVLQTQAPEAEVPPEQPALDAPLELYAMALDEDVAIEDFDLIDNLEVLELLAALEEDGGRG